MNTLFMVIDCQQSFFDKDSKMYVEGTEEIKGNIRRLQKFAWDKGIQIIATGDSHAPSSSELSNNPDFKETFPTHCLIGTKGGSFIDELDDLWFEHNNFYVWQEEIDKGLIYELGDIALYKDQFDVFAGNNVTEDILRVINPDIVVVYGVVTSVCVNFAVIGLLKRGYKVTVVTDAIKDLPGSTFDMSTWEVKGNKAKLMKTEDIIKESVG